jgi:hexose-6-phosphate dehydrogenase
MLARVFFLALSCGLVSCFTNFILVGSTGDLAKKYLWEALFIQYIEVALFFDAHHSLSQNNLGDTVNIYAAATRSEAEGYPIISSYLNSLHCKTSWSPELCREGRQKFSERISYVQLRSHSDYQLLNTKIFHPEETLRIFYLSVSPSLYQSIAFNIDQFSRPNNELRVVFEKPFGMVTIMSCSFRPLIARLGLFFCD